MRRDPLHSAVLCDLTLAGLSPSVQLPGDLRGRCLPAPGALRSRDPLQLDQTLCSGGRPPFTSFPGVQPRPGSQSGCPCGAVALLQVCVLRAGRRCCSRSWGGSWWPLPVQRGWGPPPWSSWFPRSFAWWAVARPSQNCPASLPASLRFLQSALAPSSPCRVFNGYL